MNYWLKVNKDRWRAEALKKHIGKRCIGYYEGGREGDFSDAGVLTDVHFFFDTEVPSRIKFEVDGEIQDTWWIWMSIEDPIH